MQQKLKKLLVPLTIMLSLIGTITAVMTYANLSPTQPFIDTWLTAFVFAFVVMLPIGIVILSAMTKLVNRFFSHLSVVSQRLIQGVMMAVVMESILALVTTAVNHDYQNLLHFVNLASTSFLYAIPVGISFACLMTFVLQPKLQRYLATSNA
ncbi:DUF2798 domain-containing protein [Psychromonas sp. KJ10-10]|uniref:DUF2798 domain-containing protein n=1 Tax=Psychromonas sp. KJ10-10 TaxID=3391823 RepID=UPI0039B691AC